VGSHGRKQRRKSAAEFQYVKKIIPLIRGKEKNSLGSEICADGEGKNCLIKPRGERERLLKGKVMYCPLYV